MPSIPAIQADASTHRSYSPWLERLFEHLTTAAVSVYRLVVFLNEWTVVIITFGAPYLQYKLYRHDEEDDTYPSEKYSQMIEALNMLWDHYSKFLLHILPVVFPMVATSGLPLCSFASFTATMTVIVGGFNIGTRIVFRLKGKALQKDHVINEWLKASKTSWRKVPNKSFWVLISLPTVTFSWSIGLLVSTVVLTFWERSVVGTVPSLEMQGCPTKRLQVFQYTLLATFVAAVIQLAFITIKLFGYDRLTNS